MTSFCSQVLGSGTGQYLADASGNPWLLRGDSMWALVTQAGYAGGSTTYQSDIDLYMSTRASQGFNAAIIDTICSGGEGLTIPNSNGNTWDNVAPWSGGIGSMNSAYWTRMDYVMSSAQSNGITVFMVVADRYALDPGGAFNGITTGQATTYGTALATRYASAPNLVWLFGNDYSGQYDSIYNAILTALRSGGDSHLVTVENLTEGDSRYSDQANSTYAFGLAHAQFNFVYTYAGCYPCLNYAYQESSPLAVVLGDGHYDNDGTPTQPSAARDFMRLLTWWSLSSGSRGYMYGDQALISWNPHTNLTTIPFATTDLGNIWNAYSSLSGWHKLVPDTGSVFVTGGRGTALGLFAANNGSEYTGFSGGSNLGSRSYYVTASITPDGSLAVLYLPDATGTQNGGPVTIDQTKMVSGYTAYWMDPATGAMTSTTAGSSYSNSSTNSQGGNDWVLVLQGSASKSGTDSATGTEAQSAATSFQVVSSSDSGHGTDLVWWGGERAYGRETESVFASTVTKSGTDSATGAEAQFVRVSSSDAATLAETASTRALVSDHDAATGADNGSITGGTTYRLMDGASGRPGVGSTGTQPPAAATSYTGNYIAGLVFEVTEGGMWFEGYWWYCCASGQSTSPVECALWCVTGQTTGILVPGTTVTSGTLVPGEFNYIPLSTPVQLAIGTAYTAQVAQNGNFPDTQHQFGSGDPYSAGIVNGPLKAFGDVTSGGTNGFGYYYPQGPYSTAGSDPTTTFAATGDLSDILWLDVQVSSTPPAGFTGSWRLWPNKLGGSYYTAADTNSPFTLATEVHVSEAGGNAWAWFYSIAGSASLPTWAGLYRISDQSVVTQNSAPSWKTPDGLSSATAGGGWCKCALPGTIPPGVYKVAVYNSAGASGAWSSREYEYFSAGNGSAGITSGLLSSPANSAAANADVYTNNPSASPPYAQGTVEPANGTFAVDDSVTSGAAQYPYLCADYTIDVGTPSGAVAESFWVDLELTPFTSVSDSDSATGSDTGIILARTTGSDTGHGTEAQFIAQQAKAGSDTGHGTESQSQSTAGGGGTQNVSSTDTGRGQEGDVEGYAAPTESAAGTDAQSFPVAAVPAADMAAGSDAQSLRIAVQAVRDADSGTGTEAQALIGLRLADSDAATGADASAGPLIRVSDAGTGADELIYDIDIYPFPPPWLENVPGGGFRLIWRPGWGRALVWNYGLADEQTVLTFERGHDPSHVMSRFEGSTSHRMITDYDFAEGGESHRPTATVEHRICVAGQEDSG